MILYLRYCRPGVLFHITVHVKDQYVTTYDDVILVKPNRYAHSTSVGRGGVAYIVVLVLVLEYSGIKFILYGRCRLYMHTSTSTCMNIPYNCSRGCTPLRPRFALETFLVP